MPLICWYLHMPALCCAIFAIAAALMLSWHAADFLILPCHYFLCLMLIFIDWLIFFSFTITFLFLLLLPLPYFSPISPRFLRHAILMFRHFWCWCWYDADAIISLYFIWFRCHFHLRHFYMLPLFRWLTLLCAIIISWCCYFRSITPCHFIFTISRLPLRTCCLFSFRRFCLRRRQLFSYAHYAIFAIDAYYYAITMPFILITMLLLRLLMTWCWLLFIISLIYAAYFAAFFLMSLYFSPRFHFNTLLPATLISLPLSLSFTSCWLFLDISLILMLALCCHAIRFLCCYY